MKRQKRPRRGSNDLNMPLRRVHLTHARAVVLKNLQKITVEFVKQVGREKKMPEAIINEAGGKIFTYGSYRLGVFGPGELILFIIHK